MTAAILCIGTELTRGELADTNGAWLAEQLTRRGHEVAIIELVPDDPQRVLDALAHLGKSHEVVISTGGLGPTTDDLTTACVAEYLGVPLVRDEASLSRIRERMSRFGRTMPSCNEKQADFPGGATILPNHEGTAPGFLVELGGAVAAFLPGVPHEMRAMFLNAAVPLLPHPTGAPCCQVQLNTFGLGEGAINERLTGIAAEHAVIIGYRARFPEVEVKLCARGATAEEAEQRARAAGQAVRQRLGDVVYGEGTDSLPSVVHHLLLERGLTLAVAESCTGGLVGKLLTDLPGASATFLGGVLAYSDAVKQELLGVDPATLAAHGAVSTETALEMAAGVRLRLRANLGLAITGIAGPTGGSPEKPVGLVHLAVAGDRTMAERSISHPGSRDWVRTLAAHSALALVRHVLLEALVQSTPEGARAPKGNNSKRRQ